MRFTVRRPPTGEVSPCGHRPSGGDVACSVDVGVAPTGGAGFALEDRLALAVSECDAPARGASLRRVRSRDLLDPAESLVLQARDELAPVASADRAVEPTFLGTPAPGCPMVPRAERIIARTSRSSTLITSNRRARSVVVFSTQSFRRSLSRAFSFAIAVSSSLGGWNRACSGPVAAATPSTASTHPGKPRCVQQFAGRQRSHTQHRGRCPPRCHRPDLRSGRAYARTRHASGQPDPGNPIGFHTLGTDRDRRNRTHPILGTHTRPKRRFSRST